MTRLERSVAAVLRTGVLLSSACLAAGIVVSLAAPGRAGDVLLHVGLIILLCTPVARVFISTIEYVLVRDWLFAALTTIVLLELVASGVAALVFNRRL